MPPPLTIFGLVRTVGTARSLQEGTIGARLILTSDHRLTPPQVDLVIVECKRMITVGPWRPPRPAAVTEWLPKPLTADMVRYLFARLGACVKCDAGCDCGH